MNTFRFDVAASFKKLLDEGKISRPRTLEEQELALREYGVVMDQQDETNELTPFQKDMINRFSHHDPPNENVTYAYETMRNACLDLSSFIGQYVPKGREQSLAITNLEQVMFWSNAGIARNQEE